MAWQCFLLTATDRAWRYLRRYSSGSARVHADGTMHDAMALLEIAGLTIAPDGTYSVTQEADIPHDDPRWPARCDECGYAFRPDDVFQVFHDRIYQAEDGRQFSVHVSPLPHKAPPGAMWEAPWLNHDWHTSDFYQRRWKGSREPLNVALPDGRIWCMDAKASNGPGWEVSGTVPLLTARPSIGGPEYHGWLTDGVLSDDLEGRTYAL